VSGLTDWNQFSGTPPDIHVLMAGPQSAIRSAYICSSVKTYYRLEVLHEPESPRGAEVNAYSEEKRDWSRIDGIDLMRGLSIFLVLMNHVNMRLLGAKVPYLKGVAFRIIWRSVSEIFGVVSDLL
jgi:hypothetical protein